MVGSGFGGKFGCGWRRDAVPVPVKCALNGVASTFVSRRMVTLSSICSARCTFALFDGETPW